MMQNVNDSTTRCKQIRYKRETADEVRNQTTMASDRLMHCEYPIAKKNTLNKKEK